MKVDHTAKDGISLQQGNNSNPGNKSGFGSNRDRSGQHDPSRKQPGHETQNKPGHDQSRKNPSGSAERRS